MTTPVLAVDGLSVSYRTDRGPLAALRAVDLSIGPGEIVGLVGESGCGKSTLISAIIRLLAPNAAVVGGSIRFCDTDLLALDEAAMRGVRGQRLAMVFQDPMTSLNPVLTIGRQMADIQFRDRAGRAEKRAKAEAMLAAVGLPDPASRLNDYPHELSGGMKQRVAIAMALLMKPALLIADEPTTALDATLEIQIIDRLKELQSEIGCSILFISHHLGVIAELCDRVVVMYAGEVVESADTTTLFRAPRHPYTQALLACDPGSIVERTRQLPIIPGSVPDLVDLPTGCVFRDRCDRAGDVCATQRPVLETVGRDHRAACHFAGPIA